MIIGIIDTDGKIVVSDESTRGEFVTLPDDDKDKALLRGA